MDYLNRESVLQADDLIYEDVDVPEWGGKVRVRCMTGTERDAYEASLYDVKGDKVEIKKDNVRAKLVAQTLCTEEGQRMFSEADVAILGKKSAKALDRVFTVAQRLNALTRDEQENLAKN